MSRPTRRLARASAFTLAGAVALVALALSGSSAQEGQPPKDLPAAATKKSSSNLSFAPGQALNLTLDWTGNPNPAPKASQCYVGPDPVGKTHAWGHRMDPTLLTDPNSTSQVLVFHVIARSLPNMTAKDGRLISGAGSITIQATDTTGTTTTAPVPVTQITTDPCNE